LPVVQLPRAQAQRDVGMVRARPPPAPSPPWPLPGRRPGSGGLLRGTGRDPA